MRLARWQFDAALVVALVVALGWAECSGRRAGAWQMQAHLAESKARENGKQRDAVLRSNAALARQRDSALAVADQAAANGRVIAERAAVARVQRDSARAALRVAQSAADTISALLAKSVADDSLLQEDARLLAQKDREIEALRSSVALLVAASDSCDAQLRRDAKVEADLRAALDAAKPPSGLRVWAERALWLAAGYGLGKATP